MIFSAVILAGNKDSNVTDKLTPDYRRIAQMEQNIRDFHRFFDSNGWQKLGLFLRNQVKPYYFIRPPVWRILLRGMLSRDRALPAFTSTGVVRSGTSSMSNYIMQHPAVVLPIAKELNANIPFLNFIRAQFPTNQQIETVRKRYGVAMTGDCSPVMPSITAVHWLRQINPDMKVVVTLRDPAERVFSHWRWYKLIASRFDHDALWHNMPDVETSLRMEMDDFYRGSCGFTTFSGTGGTGFLRHSCYLPFLKQLYRQVPAERIFIVVAEEFFADPSRIARDVYRFLGLPDYQPVPVEETNPSPKVVISDELKQEVRQFFRPLNQELYDFLDRDLGWDR